MGEDILKRFYIIRHGETEPNKNQIIQGSGLDAPLNQTGEKQAADFFRAYHHIHFDAVYTSMLVRTWQSVNQFIEKGILHHSMSELNEISWGVKDGTRINNEEQKIYQAMINDWKEGLLDMSFENGESPKQVEKRMKGALKLIMERKEEKTVLMCIHGRAMRIFLCILLKLSLTEMEGFLHSNLCLYVLDWDGKKWNIVVQNDASHILY